MQHVKTSIQACDQLLAGKNSLLDSLYQELKSAEDEYVKTLKKQYDDLEIVAQRSEEQYKTMDQAYRNRDDFLPWVTVNKGTVFLSRFTVHCFSWWLCTKFPYL